MNQYALTVQLAVAHDPHPRPIAAPSAKMREEEALYNRFLAGDNQACLALFQRHNQRLFTYCLKMVGDGALAEDLAQESWGRLVELRAAGRTLENPIGFLMRIARNLCLDHIKSRKWALSLETLHESSHPSYSMREPSEMEELVVSSLEKLSFDHREVLVLNIYCGYSFEEIAKMLGKSPESIWTRASRARAALRKLVHAARDNGTSATSHDKTGEDR